MAGILDVAGLADCLIGYYAGKADEDILDLYAKIRREKFVDFIDRRSRRNLNRISKTDPATALETDPFLVLLEGLKGDEQKTKEFLLVSLVDICLRIVMGAEALFRRLAVSSTILRSTI
jgi:hypothetical protein